MNIFLTSQASTVLERIVSLLPKEPSEYRVLFIPTAAKPYPDAPWMHTDRDELVRLGFQVSDLELSVSKASEVENAVQCADVIFVAGGNTFYLLEQAKKVGFIDAVKEAVTNGKIYIGSSAGSVLVTPDIKYVELFDDPSVASLEDTKALGLVNFRMLPHASNPKYQELKDKTLAEYQSEDSPIILVSDNEFLLGNGELQSVENL